MGKFKMITIAVLALCLSVALAGIASAAPITCGDCHSAPPVDADNCSTNARGLHGTHVNYSSATFKKTVAAYGKCAYCHTATTSTSPTATHNDGYVNITGANTVNTIHAVGLTENKATKTCTNACHKNAGATAKWGNYTATTTGGIVLSCASCHSDASDNGASLTSPSSKGHTVHLNGSWLGTGVKIVLGSYSGYMRYGTANGNTNAVCQFCHPDNTGDLWKNGKADDGTKKAYPHAKDGTNVVSMNAVVGGTAGVTLSNYSASSSTSGNFTCTNSCHFNRSTYETANPRWNDTWASGTGSHCDMCHNHQPSAGINVSATLPLTYAHALHFQNISTMYLRKASCNDCHNSIGLHTNYAGVVNLVQLPVKAGTAGLGNTFAGTVSVGWSATGTLSTSGTCQNNCHINASPAWNSIATNSLIGITGCATCHEYPGVAGRDWTGTNGHMVRYDAPVVNTHMKATGFDKNATYSTQVGSGGACNLCHSGGTHANGTVDVTPNGNNNCGVGNFGVNVNASGSNVTCGNVKCHSGKTTPNWWD